MTTQLALHAAERGTDVIPAGSLSHLTAALYDDPHGGVTIAPDERCRGNFDDWLGVQSDVSVDGCSDASTLTVSMRAVDVVRHEPEMVVISGGLVSGEIVVTAGVHALHPGQKIRLLGSQP